MAETEPNPQYNKLAIVAADKEISMSLMGGEIRNLRGRIVLIENEIKLSFYKNGCYGEEVEHYRVRHCEPGDESAKSSFVPVTYVIIIDEENLETSISEAYTESQLRQMTLIRRLWHKHTEGKIEVPLDTLLANYDFISSALKE